MLDETRIRYLNNVMSSHIEELRSQRRQIIGLPAFISSIFLVMLVIVWATPDLDNPLLYPTKGVLFVGACLPILMGIRAYTSGGWNRINFFKQGWVLGKTYPVIRDYGNSMTKTINVGLLSEHFDKSRIYFIPHFNYDTRYDPDSDSFYGNLIVVFRTKEDAVLARLLVE